jgi:hypothetical protein
MVARNLNRRSVVQAHLYQHIGDQIEIDTVRQDDAVWVRGWHGLVPLSDSRAEMFVHPRTDILLPNRARVIEVQRVGKGSSVAFGDAWTVGVLRDREAAAHRATLRKQGLVGGAVK